jgi:glycine/D-amino acid oxidase-like deaminating enzyme
MADYDTVIIGGGLFGKMIAKALSVDGQTVLVVDRGERLAGSRPAACLIKPSWLGGMGEHRDPAMRKLSELYDVQELEFAVGALGVKIKMEKVFWVDPSTILRGGEPTNVLDADVQVINKLDHGWEVSMLINGGQYEATARNVVVAAGVWTEQLLPQFRQTAQWGGALLYRNAKIKQPFIRPWAPYKQLVAFNRGDGLWVGDGSALKHANVTKERMVETFNREAHAVDLNIWQASELEGLRPYTRDHKPCLLEEVEPSLWAASGGAKNGTIAAAHCARVISEKLS